jgi:ribosomal-protein-alanine N-acetyltransferase
MALLTATPSHAAVLEAIHAACFPTAEQWNALAFATQLSLPGCFGLLDPEGALLLGRVAADEAEVLALAVLPGLRRAGRAKTLLGRAEHQAATAGARNLFLEVSAANAPARALYAGMGYSEVGRRRRYYADGTDALLLRHALIICAAITAG